MSGGKLIHHIQCDDHRDVQLEQLHREVEIPFDVGRIDDIDNAFRLCLQYIVPRNQLFTGIGRHGIDAGKIGEHGVGNTADHPFLSLNRDAGEIADVLAGAGQLVEQCGFAAVLIAHQGKVNHGAVRQRISASFGMKLSGFAKTRMRDGFRRDFCHVRAAFFRERLHCDILRFRKPQGQTVSA